MATIFRYLVDEILADIVSHVEIEDVPTLASTCLRFDRICLEVHGIGRSSYNIQVMIARRAAFRHAHGLSVSPIATPSLANLTIGIPLPQGTALINTNTMAPNQRVVHFVPGGNLNGGVTSTSTSQASSPTSNTFDVHTSSDTDLTTPEEDDWEFELTPDIIHRLNKLPARKSGATLPSLPTELQCEIFSYLDQIDATCLGLSSPRAYAIYRSIHGVKMPLNTRRQGPNLMERAWEVVGKQECAHCGIYRCELHQHIKDWMPKDLEYCSFKMMFGGRAEEGMAENCFRGKPSKPRRCGRHPLRTTSVHQDDSLAMQAAR